MCTLSALLRQSLWASPSFERYVLRIMKWRKRAKTESTDAGGECHLIEHTADIGLRCKAPTLERLFECSARGMFEIVASLDYVNATQSVPITLQAADLEELFVSWLGELLYIWESRRMLVSKFTVSSVRPRSLEAEVAGETYDPSRHELQSEIKAATYHGLQIERKGKAWEVQVIFDL
jgi:SHS2 domain-containing protein